MRTRHHGRRDPRDDLVFRLDRRGRGLAGLHRRYRRRAQSERGQRAAEDPRGAAATIAVPARQPRAGAGACRPSCRAAANCRCGRWRPPTSSAPRRRPPDLAIDDPALSEAADASEGSVARALTLLGGDALKLQQRTAALLATLPQVDPRELHALGRCARRQRPGGAGGLHRQRRSLGRRAPAQPTMPTPTRTCRALHGWRRCGKRSTAPRATPQDYNLERKPLVFSVFGMLAEATR